MRFVTYVPNFVLALGELWSQVVLVRLLKRDSRNLRLKVACKAR